MTPEDMKDIRSSLAQLRIFIALAYMRGAMDKQSNPEMPIAFLEAKYQKEVDSQLKEFVNFWNF